jgi:hypothetical protein
MAQLGLRRRLCVLRMVDDLLVGKVRDKGLWKSYQAILLVSLDQHLQVDDSTISIGVGAIA